MQECGKSFPNFTTYREPAHLFWNQQIRTRTGEMSPKRGQVQFPYWPSLAMNQDVRQ